MILPPTTIAELKARTEILAGKTLGEIAAHFKVEVPSSLNHAKGWIGQLIEKILGANANNLDQPDFVQLGVELKTIPISLHGQPTESTYICTASIPNTDTHWVNSRVFRKIAHMLWVPIEVNPKKPLSELMVGTAILWSPPPMIAKQLAEDWEELTELIILGHFDALSAHRGKYLQIRPKAANSKTFIQVVNHEGQRISIVPKGFYLRRSFTQQILQENYANVSKCL